MHRKSYIPGYYTMRDFNDERRNSWPMHYENKIMNRHLYRGCIPNSSAGYSECDKRMLKLTMLEHEAIFRKQVFELHRLYRIQKDLMEGFQKYDITRSFTCAIKSKNSLSSLEPLSEITTSMWQIYHQPATSSSQSRETTIVSNSDISPISFCESNLQSCFGPRAVEYLERDVKSNPGFRTPTKVLFDLRLPANVYIDAKVTEGSQEGHIACSSSVTTAPYSRKYNGDPENNIKLTLSNISSGNVRENGHKYDCDRKNSLFHVLADLNYTVKDKPLQETAYSFPPRLFQLDENHRPDDSFRSNNSLLQTSFSKKLHYDERDSPNTLPTLKKELLQASSPFHREAEQFKRNIRPHSGEEKCLIFFAPLQESLIRANETILTDNNKAEIKFTPKEGIAEVLEKYSNRNGFKHSLDLDLAYSNMDLDSIESSSIDIRNGKTSPKNTAWTEIDEGCKELLPELSWLKSKPPSNGSSNLNSLSSGIGNEGELEMRTDDFPSNICCSEEKTKGNERSIFDKVHPNQIDELQGECCFNDTQKSVVNSNFRKHIDLNCEVPLLDEQSFFKMPESSDSLSASKASTLMHVDASVMALEEDNIPQIHDVLLREAAENMIKLSLDEFKHRDDEQSLHWFVNLALLNMESSSSDVVRYSEMDLFELMTLQLEEMKPDEKECCGTREAENSMVDGGSRAALLLKRPRRGQARKRRQRRDFQKDTLPGLATLSKQEMVEDLHVIGGLMRASGCHWEVGARRRDGGRNRTQAQARRRRRPRRTAVKNELSSNSKMVFVFDGPGMIDWGKTTRRCHRPRCPPQNHTTVLT